MNTGQQNATDVPILVSWYMTPLAILVVVMGDIFAKPDKTTLGFTLAFILLSSLMNVTSVILMQQSPEKVVRIRNVRVFLNYAANVLLLTMLMPYWPEIWLLVLLMAIAIGIYSSFKSTIVHCAIFALALIVIARWTGAMGGVKTGQVLLQALAILILGPFVNKLLHIYKPPVPQM